jgi:PQQ-like domain
MTEDFTTRLRLQLREAALREERRGALGRRVASVRALPPATAAGAFAASVAVGLVLVFGAWLVGSLRTEPAAPPGPRVVADVAVGESLAPSARAGFGSVWLSDTNRGEILRVDPRTRRVSARIRIGSEAGLDVGDGAVWAVARPPGTGGGELLRIDPRTNRIAARIPLRRSGDFQGLVVLAGPQVWVFGQDAAVAVDPARNRVVADIGLGSGGFQVVDALFYQGELWVTTGDRVTTRFDGRTGRRLGRLRWSPQGFLIPYADKLIEVTPRSAALVEPATGRPLWRTAVGQELRNAEPARGRLFVEGAPVGGGRDRLWEIDLRTGRVIGSVAVPEFTVQAMAALGDEIWLATAGGRAVVVAP